jgi:hypothetical protein
MEEGIVGNEALEERAAAEFLKERIPSAHN